MCRIVFNEFIECNPRCQIVFDKFIRPWIWDSFGRDYIVTNSVLQDGDQERTFSSGFSHAVLKIRAKAQNGDHAFTPS